MARAVQSLLAALALCSGVAGAEPAADLVGLLEPIDSYQAEFEQRIIDRDGSVIERSSGSMIVARGNRFRWDTDSPWAQQLVSDGHTLWQYDVELEQVVQRGFDARLQQTPGLLLAGDPAAIEQQFNVSELAAEGEGVRAFRLTPLRPDGLFASLEIRFSGIEPATMVLEDGFGQRTEIDFDHGRRNLAPDPETFKLTLPPGVDILSDVD